MAHVTRPWRTAPTLQPGAWVEQRVRSAGAPTPTASCGIPPEGIDVKPLWTRADVEHLDFIDTLPGVFPFVRGPRATMYAGSRGPSASTPASPRRGVNAFYRARPGRRADGPLGRLRPRHHRGYDSDHPRVSGDVGKAGVAIDRSRHERYCSTACRSTAFGVDDDERRGCSPCCELHRGRRGAGVPRAKLTGTIQNDILKEFMVRNTYIYPPAPRCGSWPTIIAPHGARDAGFKLDLDLRYHHAGGGGDVRPRARLTIARRARYGAPRSRAGLDIDEFAGRLRSSSRSG